MNKPQLHSFDSFNCCISCDILVLSEQATVKDSETTDDLCMYLQQWGANYKGFEAGTQVYVEETNRL